MTTLNEAKKKYIQKDYAKMFENSNGFVDEKEHAQSILALAERYELADLDIVPILQEGALSDIFLKIATGAIDDYFEKKGEFDSEHKNESIEDVQKSLDDFLQKFQKELVKSSAYFANILGFMDKESKNNFVKYFVSNVVKTAGQATKDYLMKMAKEGYAVDKSAIVNHIFDKYDGKLKQYIIAVLKKPNWLGNEKMAKLASAIQANLDAIAKEPKHAQVDVEKLRDAIDMIARAVQKKMAQTVTQKKGEEVKEAKEAINEMRQNWRGYRYKENYSNGLLDLYDENHKLIISGVTREEADDLYEEGFMDHFKLEELKKKMAKE